jgi:hypothetical protein
VSKGDRVQLAALTVHAPAPVARVTAPAARPEPDAVADLISDPVEAPLPALALPQPSGASGLFAVPESASAITAQSATPKLPTLRFQQAEPAPPEAPAEEESFLSRLFANLSG